MAATASYDKIQREQANRRERLLTTASVQSHFSTHLRDSIRPGPLRYIVTQSGVTPVVTGAARTGGIELRPENTTAAAAGSWNNPSLRMENEESAFTNFVRLNKASAQRLRRSRIYSQAYKGLGV